MINILVRFSLTDNPLYWKLIVEFKLTIGLKVDEFAAIPVFVAVIENGGFSAASRTLGVSKSAVSKRINQLESHLGVRLLHRTTRKLSLTEAGERYYEHASEALRAAGKAEDAVTELQGEPKGLLKLSCPMSFGRLHVAPLIPKFMQRYPKLQIDLVMDDKNIDLVAAGVDVAIRAGDMPNSTLIARKLAPLRQILCASPTYIERYGMPVTPSQLCEHNCILFSYSGDANQWTLNKGDQSEIVMVSGSYRVNNSEAILEALREGVGIGRLPTFVAGPDLKAGNLLRVLDSFNMPDHIFYAVFPEREYLPAKVRAFLDFTVEYFGGDQPYWDI
ncbi:MAG: DNA-binding transcriptional LysR family regulator [Gammaproteobacteria bacterium]|jgi:DNA-binding transcriptional LysR family regulator